MGGDITEAQRQDSNIQPPLKGQGCAQTVDTTPRAYDLRLIPWNGQNWHQVLDEDLFLDLRNDGTNPIYFYFATDNTVTLNEATVVAAGTPMAQSGVVPQLLPAGQLLSFRLRRGLDFFIHVKSTGGNSTLRIFPSSDSTPQPA